MRSLGGRHLAHPRTRLYDEATMHARELTLDLDPWSLFRVLAGKERAFFIDAGQPWGDEWVSSMGFRPRMQLRVTAADAPDAPFAALARMLAEAPPVRARHS